MINENKTLENFGYNSNNLSKGSRKKVYAICKSCGREKLLEMMEYNRTQGRCHKCAMEQCNSSGKNNSFYGKHHSNESKVQMSKSKKSTHSGSKNPMYGKHHSEETKHKQSKMNSGEKNPNWKGGKKISKARANAKRKRLGFISHNKPQKDFHGHHIDFNHVIFIPKELHMSISHSVINNINMDIINDAVCDWYLGFQIIN